MNRSLNVLQFTCPNGFYGAERWILALAKNLNAASVNCSLAVTKEPGSGNEEVARHFRALGNAVYEIPMTGRFDLRVIKRLCQLIKQEKIDIIHTHGYKSDILGFIAARLTGIKAISTPHGFVNVEQWKLRLYYSFGNRFFKWFDVVAPLSKQLCEDMKRLRVPDKKIHYIQNGVDVDEIESLKSIGDELPAKEAGVKRIGFIGQITKRKNIGEIIKVYRKLSAKHSNLELVLLGDGELLETFREQVKAIGDASNIKFLGFQSNRLNWLRTFDLFVMTSSLEGIPRCMMEAMAMGVPVAAYRIPGIDQLIQHGETGLLADYGDAEMLEDQWEKLLFDDGLSNRIATAGRHLILEKFSGKRMAQEYTHLFQQMMGHKAVLATD